MVGGLQKASGDMEHVNGSEDLRVLGFQFSPNWQCRVFTVPIKIPTDFSFKENLIRWILKFICNSKSPRWNKFEE